MANPKNTAVTEASAAEAPTEGTMNAVMATLAIQPNTGKAPKEQIDVMPSGTTRITYVTAED